MAMTVALVTMADVMVAITVAVWVLQIMATMAGALHLAETEAGASIGTDAVMQVEEALVLVMELTTPADASAVLLLRVVIMVVIPEDGTHQVTITTDEHSHAPEVQTQLTVIMVMAATATGAMEMVMETETQARAVLAALVIPMREERSTVPANPATTDLITAAVAITVVFRADLHHLAAHQYQSNRVVVLAATQGHLAADSVPVVVQDLQVVDLVPAVEAQDLQEEVDSIAEMAADLQ